MIDRSTVKLCHDSRQEQTGQTSAYRVRATECWFWPRNLQDPVAVTALHSIPNLMRTLDATINITSFLDPLTVVLKATLHHRLHTDGLRHHISRRARFHARLVVWTAPPTAERRLDAWRGLATTDVTFDLWAEDSLFLSEAGISREQIWPFGTTKDSAVARLNLSLDRHRQTKAACVGAAATTNFRDAL